jgi:YVTN family beta-propeller protein
MNEGNDPSCEPLPSFHTATVSVLHNSHIAVGGDKPHIKKTSCLWGQGEQFAAFSRPTAAAPQLAFVSSKLTGLITQLTADPADGDNRWSTGVPIFLCDSAKEQALGHLPCSSNPLTPNHSAPAGLFWSQATGRIYCYLSGYRTVVEIDPVTLTIVRQADITPPPPSHTVFHSVGITPDGRSLFLVGEDVDSDSDHVIGRFGSIDLTAPVLTVTELSFPQLRDIRPARFQFTPDGAKLFMTQSNDVTGLNAEQAQHLKKDVLLTFDPSIISLVTELALPPAATHGMDLWITGPQGAGSARGVVVTNATPGETGSVSLIDVATNTITATIPVGRNPKDVTVYYAGLAASDNQATPRW